MKILNTKVVFCTSIETKSYQRPNLQLGLNIVNQNTTHLCFTTVIWGAGEETDTNIIIQQVVSIIRIPLVVS